MRATRYAAAALVAAMASASPIAGAAELTIRQSDSSDIRDRLRDGLNVRGSRTSTDVVRIGVSQIQRIPEGDLALLGCDVLVVGGPEVVFLQVADGTGLLRLPDLVGESCAETLDKLLADNLEIDQTRTVTRSVAGGTLDILVWVLIRP
jgi:hypothetical protein